MHQKSGFALYPVEAGGANYVPPPHNSKAPQWGELKFPFPPPGHDTADFGVIWGRFFVDQKSTFFNFDFDKTWFGGGLDPLAVEKKNCGLFPP